jgi:hypothetical protein
MAAEPVERALAVNLGVGRVAIGLGLWLAPRLSARALGFDEADAATLVVARIAATRDLVLGAWQLSSLDDREQLAKASLAAAVCDGGDTIAFALALRDPATRTAGIRGVALAAAATLAGAWLATRD